MGSISSTGSGIALAIALCLLVGARAQFLPGGQPTPNRGVPQYYNPNNQFPQYNPYLIPRFTEAQHQDFTPYGCSQRDGSALAIEACINAVRGNPQFFQPAARCDLSRLQRAPPLTLDTSLGAAAQLHVRYMNTWHQLTHAGYQDRILNSGFLGGNYVNENIAFTDGSSALHTVMQWLCSPRDGKHIMDCGYQYFGGARLCPYSSPVSGCFYSVEFGGNGAQCPRNPGTGGGFGRGNFGPNPTRGPTAPTG